MVLVGQARVEQRRSGEAFPAGEEASGKEEAPVGGAEVARVGRRESQPDSRPVDSQRAWA